VLSPQWLHAEIQRKASGRRAPAGPEHWRTGPEPDLPSCSSDEEDVSSCTSQSSSSSSFSSASSRGGCFSGGEAKEAMQEDSFSGIEEPPALPRGTAARTFAQGAFLGEGAFGTVVEARHRVDGKCYALKRVVLGGQDDGIHALREVQTMACLPPHPHVVRYHASWVETMASGGLRNQGILPSGASDAESSCGEDPSQSFDDFEPPASLPCWDTSLWSESPRSPGSPKCGSHGTASVLLIQMELCEGTTLADWLREGANPSREGRSAAEGLVHRMDAVGQLLQGVAHLHASGVEHRDLSPRNIFRARPTSVAQEDTTPVRWCVGDFTFATAMHTDESPRDALAAPAGTPLYAAPELAELAEPNSPRSRFGASDVYSAGLIAAEAFLQCQTRMETVAVLQDLRRGGRLPKHVEDAVGAELVELIGRMVATVPESRPTMLEVLDSWTRAKSATSIARCQSTGAEGPIRHLPRMEGAAEHAMALQGHLKQMASAGCHPGAALRQHLVELQELIHDVLASPSSYHHAGS